MSAHCSLGTVQGISERSLRAYSLFMFMYLSFYVDEGDNRNDDADDEYSEAEGNK
jgi:hypothetical protein